MSAYSPFNQVVHTAWLSTQGCPWTRHTPRAVSSPWLFVQSCSSLWEELPFPELAVTLAHSFLLCPDPSSRSSKLESILAAISPGDTKGYRWESVVSIIDFRLSFSSTPALTHSPPLSRLPQTQLPGLSLSLLSFHLIFWVPLNFLGPVACPQCLNSVSKEPYLCSPAFLLKFYYLVPPPWQPPSYFTVLWADPFAYS